MAKYEITVSFIDGSNRASLAMEACAGEHISSVLERYGLLVDLQVGAKRLREKDGALLTSVWLEYPDSVVESTPLQLEIGDMNLEDGVHASGVFSGFICWNPACPAEGRGQYRNPLYGLHTRAQARDCRRTPENKNRRG